MMEISDIGCHDMDAPSEQASDGINAGLETDLNTAGLQYNHALAIFFPFYVIVEVPSNMIMKRTRPALWIPFIMVPWGYHHYTYGLGEELSGTFGCTRCSGYC
jgi:hypothetical protein